MSKLDIAVLVSSYQRPFHLKRVLESLACQQGVAGRFEVVVTDDGSTDETHSVVERLARRVSFPLRMTTHEHCGFQLARCRNEGVAASSASYLLFLDGDCLVPPDHVWHHLQQARLGRVMAGYCCLLEPEISERLTCRDVRDGRFVQLATKTERRKIRRMHHKSLLYRALGHPKKPKLYGGNVGITRSDYLLVNGYDENFVGWGCEDDDLRLRLRASSIRIHSILNRTCTYHLWHPPGETTPDAWRDGANVGYLLRSDRKNRCDQGIAGYLSGERTFNVVDWQANHTELKSSESSLGSRLAS